MKQLIAVLAFVISSNSFAVAPLAAFKAVVNSPKVEELVKKQEQDGFKLDGINAGDKVLRCPCAEFKLKFEKKVKDAVTGQEKELKKKFPVRAEGQKFENVTISENE